MHRDTAPVRAGEELDLAALADFALDPAIALDLVVEALLVRVDVPAHEVLQALFRPGKS